MFANLYPTGNYNDGEIFFFTLWVLGIGYYWVQPVLLALTNTKSIQNDIGNLLKNFAADANDTFVPCFWSL